MTTTEDWTLVNDVYNEPHPLKVDQRRDVLAAYVKCAEAHDGLVHASWVREFLPEAVNPRLIGNVASQLANAGILGKTGRFLPSGQKANRNAHHELPVRRVLDWDALRAEASR